MEMSECYSNGMGVALVYTERVERMTSRLLERDAVAMRE